MSNYIYTNDGLVNVDELMHYGVPGMKWGRRKPQSYVAAKNKRKQALRDYRNATREFRSFDGKGLERANKAEKKYVDADVKFATEKAKYKASKAKTAEKREKKEFNAYTREFVRSGLPGSVADRGGRRKYTEMFDKVARGRGAGRSTALYNKVARDKGKKYADKVVRKAQNRSVASLAGAVVVIAGLQVASAVLKSRYD